MKTTNLTLKHSGRVILLGTTLSLLTLSTLSAQPGPKGRPGPSGGPAPGHMVAPANPAEAAQAVQAAQQIAKSLTAGAAWMHTGRHGAEIKVALVANGVIVDDLQFDTAGNLLPEGLSGGAITGQASPESVRPAAQQAIQQLQALPAARYSRREAAWIVPVAAGNLIVAEIKIGPNGQVIPDYGAMREASAYGMR